MLTGLMRHLSKHNSEFGFIHLSIITNTMMLGFGPCPCHLQSLTEKSKAIVKSQPPLSAQVCYLLQKSKGRSRVILQNAVENMTWFY